MEEKGYRYRGDNLWIEKYQFGSGEAEDRLDIDRKSQYHAKSIPPLCLQRYIFKTGLKVDKSLYLMTEKLRYGKIELLLIKMVIKND